MAKQTVNIGIEADDDTGDQLRDAFDKINDNFDEIYDAGPVETNIVILGNTISSSNTDGNIVLTPDGSGETNISSTLNVTGDLVVSVDISVVDIVATGNVGCATISSSGLATLNSLSVTADGSIGNDLSVGGDLTVDLTLDVTGQTDLGTLVTSGLATLDSLDVTNSAAIGTTLGVSGETTLADLLNADGGIDVSSGKFSVDGTTGDTIVAGTLVVDDATGFSANVVISSGGTLTVDGLITASAGITSEGDVEITGTNTLTVNGAAEISDVDVDDGVISRTTANQNLTIQENGDGKIVLDGKLHSVNTVPPSDSTGINGDEEGDIAIDDNYIYYCIDDWVTPGTADIWVRVAFTGGAWS